MKSREGESPAWRANTDLDAGVIKMMTKSEIALLAITVLGTLAAWLAAQNPSLVRPIYGEASIACSVPVSAFWGVRPSFGEEKVLFDQVSRMFRAFQ
jgi:hypothetical protein